MKFPCVAFDSMEFKPLLGENIKILKIKNLDITPDIVSRNPYLEKIYVPGKTYLAFFHHKYFHQMADMLARYDYIKEYEENLNIHFFVNRNLPLFSGYNKTNLNEFIDFLLKSDSNQERFIHEDEPVYNKFFEDLLPMYANEDSKVFNLYTSNVIFEEVVIIVDTEFPVFKLRNYPDDSQIVTLLMNYEVMEIPKVNGICIHEENRSICSKCNFTIITFSKSAKNIKQKIISKNQDFNGYEKIFISRKNSNNAYKKMIDICLMENDYDQASYLSSRLIKFHDEIENILISKGFKVLDFEGMSFKEQVMYMSKAKIVCGFSGSSLINTGFCDKNATVIEINTNQDYRVRYEIIVKEFVNNYINISIDSKNREDIYTIFDM